MTKSPYPSCLRFLSQSLLLSLGVSCSHHDDTTLFALGLAHESNLHRDPRSEQWYVDPDRPAVQDEPFRHIGLDLTEQFCPVRIRLHYRLASSLQGVMPYPKD